MRTLEEFRLEIDGIDDELIRTLARRLRLCEQIARFKKEREIPMMQRDRVAMVLTRCGALAAQHGIDTEFVTRIYGLIIDESCRLETGIIGDTTDAQNPPGRPLP